ncbi:TPA: hypothetical protein N3D68_000772 [Salmonella enterica subsp. enterica serovar Muenchen]|nr:hypothetical protein [Salmonella enterica subsp. enterica serovar Muenchen]
MLITIEDYKVFHYEILPDEAEVQFEPRMVDKMIPDGKGGLMKSGEKVEEQKAYQVLYVYTGDRFPRAMKYQLNSASDALVPGKYLPGFGTFAYNEFGSLKFGYKPVLVPFVEAKGK